MKNDKLIKEKISILQDNINYYNAFPNPCASQDRAVEDIVNTANEIGELYNEQFAEENGYPVYEEQTHSKKR